MGDTSIAFVMDTEDTEDTAFRGPVAGAYPVCGGPCVGRHSLAAADTCRRSIAVAVAVAVAVDVAVIQVVVVVVVVIAGLVVLIVVIISVFSKFKQSSHHCLV